MRTFDAPIPGQSLTDTPRNAAYERPPEISDPMEAIDVHLDNLNKDGAMDDVIYFLEMGVDLKTMVQGILRSGVVAGLHSIDVSLIIAPIIHEYIKGFAEALDVEFDEGFEDKEGKEIITYRREASRARKVLDELRKKQGMEPLPEPEIGMEEPEEATEDTAEVEQEEPAKTGLMARV
jgi:hypothetical protein